MKAAVVFLAGPGSRLARRPRRWTVVLALTLGLICGWAAPAAADPAGPTDYQSEIVSVEPPVDGVELAIIGGDSFVELVASPGVTVDVVGYQREPYLRFLPDGTVLQNERSPSRWLNDDRYGQAEPPPDAVAEAAPRWIEVADGGTFAWHDHRAHWMNEDRPLGREPGDVILEAVIPIVVDNAEVEVSVRSRLLSGPSPWPTAAGAALALAASAVTVFGVPGRGADRDQASGPGRGVKGALALTAVWALGATLVGRQAVAGLPGEAAPGVTFWLLPVLAALAALGGIAVLVRPNGSGLAALLGPALLALAGLELLMWFWLRRLVLTRALIPTEGPEWLDRSVVAGSIVVGVAALVVAVRTLLAPVPVPPRQPSPST